MLPEDEIDPAIEALLDGRPFVPADPPRGGPGAASDALRVVDLIARTCREALFGDAALMLADQPTRWGHLELHEEIGRGASGTVYRAWDPQLCRDVALKLFDDDICAADAALEEGRLLARLRHPHIVTVFGADVHDGIAGIWLELIDGETLDAELARDGPFGIGEATLVGLDLAAALSAVHSAGLLHRDVKARNIVRELGGRVVLMDLGSGRGNDVAPPSGDGTGTPMYMAPEVMAGEPASARSDIYSLGVVLYRLLSGTYPVVAADLPELRAAHAAGRRARLADARPDVSADVAAVIERACHPDARNRYDSAAELEAALRAALASTEARTNPVASVVARGWARWRRRVAIATVTAALVLSTCVLAWDTNLGRSFRRAAGMTVPPRSVLYTAMHGGVAIIRGRTIEWHAHNPGTANVIAVSTDLGIRTMSTGPPWMQGGAFHLDGTPEPGSRATPPGLCCFDDGTTDGRYNYASRTDSTLTGPLGSRLLAPPAVYRFGRDWSNPTQLFLLTAGGTYRGIAYDPAWNAFWLTRQTNSGTILERWDKDGRLAASSLIATGAALTGIAVDPLDGTLWTIRSVSASSTLQLENFDRTGRYLGAIAYPRVANSLGGAALEAEWTRRR